MLSPMSHMPRALKNCKRRNFSSSSPLMSLPTRHLCWLVRTDVQADLQRLVLLLQAVSPKQENVQLAATYGRSIGDTGPISTNLGKPWQPSMGYRVTWICQPPGGGT